MYILSDETEIKYVYLSVYHLTYTNLLLTFVYIYYFQTFEQKPDQQHAGYVVCQYAQAIPTVSTSLSYTWCKHLAWLNYLVMNLSMWILT